MADKEKMSLFEFVKQLRENVDVPADMDDKTLIKAVLKAKPELRDRFHSYEISRLTGEPRSSDEIFKPENAVSPNAGQPPSGNAVTRFFKGFFDNFSPDKLAAMGMASSPFTDPDRKGKTLMEQNTGISPEDAVMHPSQSVQKVANVPGMTKSLQQGDIAGAAGKGTFSAVMLESMAKDGGVRGEAEAPGAALERFNKMVASVSAPLKATLDSQYAVIDGAMANQYINAQRLSAGIAHAKNVVAKIERSPGVKVGDLSAAQGAVARLSNGVKASKNMPWTDARQSLITLNKAKTKVKESTELVKSLNDITDALEPELQTAADKAGQGAEWEKITKDYNKYKQLQRDYADVLKKQTEAQKEENIATSGARFKLGRSRQRKLQKAGAERVKAAHAAFKDLHNQIKTPAKPRPPTTPPSSTPPVSGGSQGAAGVGKGVHMADPRTGEQLLQAAKDLGGGSAKTSTAPQPPTPAPEPQWPDQYKGGAQTLGKGGGGGANYTADELAAFKKKHGIE
jgi:hypothetical protein